MNLTFDSNIWIGAYDAYDPQQPVYLEVLKRIISSNGIMMYSPLLMEVEVLGSIARKTRNYAKINDAQKRMRSISRQIWIPLDNWLATEAARCATSFYLRGADAVYVATALSNNATLVTFDQEIIDRASSALPVLKPDEWLKTRAQPL